MATEAEAIDASRVERFAEHLLDTLNRGAVSVMISIGHRTGLFDTMAGMEPATSERIAEAAGLQERYVREWLNGMTVARVVEHDPQGRTYWLPAEHAACLTRAAGADNMGVFAQYIGVVASAARATCTTTWTIPSRPSSTRRPPCTA
jgi:hypothetical protein